VPAPVSVQSELSSRGFGTLELCGPERRGVGYRRAEPARAEAAAPGHCGRAAAQAISGMIRIATMLATLIMGLIAGPAVSL
jgi:hypothetical protein